MSTTRYAKRGKAAAGTRAPERRRNVSAGDARDNPDCNDHAEALVGFTVRSRFTGNVFVVTDASERRGSQIVRGRDCWATLDAVTVIAPPEEVSRW